MSQQSMPQYNSDPNVPVGFIGSSPEQMSIQNQGMNQEMTQRMNINRDMNASRGTQLNRTLQKKHILFFQPSCQHSQEFLKLLNFSRGMSERFIQINVLTPNQKIPDKVQVTPTIFTVPEYNMYSADDAFKWLQQEIIREQRNRNNPHQNPQQQTTQSQRSQQIPQSQQQKLINGGVRMNAPSFSGNGNGGAPITRSGPAGQSPSDSFNTYDPNRDGGVMPFMSDMGSNRTGNFSYLNVDSAPPFNYAHVAKDDTQQNTQQANPSMMQQRGRPKKLEDSKYEAFLAQRQADPYIQQSMPSSY
jgi:hypothetical protein